MPLEPGVTAPLFEGQDQNGNTIRLQDYLGKTVILYFYPKDDTPLCTATSCNLRDNYEALLAKDYVVLGVSPDDSASHKKFAEKYKFPFPLVADPDQAIHKLYGTWIEKSMYGRKYMGTDRTTFVIDAQGNIAHTVNRVDTKNHTEQILSLS